MVDRCCVYLLILVQICIYLCLVEEGLPNRGILDVAYFSGEGARKNGCIALPKFRKSLLYLTLLEEHEIVEEEHRAHQTAVSGMQTGGNAEHHDVGLTAIKLETGNYCSRHECVRNIIYL